MPPPEVIDIDAIPDEPTSIPSRTRNNLNNINIKIKVKTNNSTTPRHPNDDLANPTPDIHFLFRLYNEKHFENRLQNVYVEYSKRMTLCAGTCTYRGPAGGCRIGLSEPLLKLRPATDLRSTLLHEMIHAHLFFQGVSRDGPDGHGPLFLSIAKQINAVEVQNGIEVTPYHTFQDEVDHYRTHHWKCDRCGMLIKRAMNRPPGQYDTFWTKHEFKCGGKFIKIKEPPPKEKEAKINLKSQKSNNSQVVAVKMNDLKTNEAMKRKLSQSNEKSIGHSNNKHVVKTFRIDEMLTASASSQFIKPKAQPKTATTINMSTQHQRQRQQNDKTNCPVCNIPVPTSYMNTHLDKCLAGNFDDDVLQVDEVNANAHNNHVNVDANTNTDIRSVRSVPGPDGGAADIVVDSGDDHDDNNDDDIVLVPSTPTPPSSPKRHGMESSSNQHSAPVPLPASTAVGTHNMWETHDDEILVPPSPPLSTPSSSSQEIEPIVSTKTTSRLKKKKRSANHDTLHDDHNARPFPLPINSSSQHDDGNTKNKPMSLSMPKRPRYNSTNIRSRSSSGGASNTLINLALDPSRANAEEIDIEITKITSESKLSDDIDNSNKHKTSCSNSNNNSDSNKKTFKEILKPIMNKQSPADLARMAINKSNVLTIPPTGSNADPNNHDIKNSKPCSISILAQKIGRGFDQSQTIDMLIQNGKKLPDGRGYNLPVNDFEGLVKLQFRSSNNNNDNNNNNNNNNSNVPFQSVKPVNTTNQYDPWDEEAIRTEQPVRKANDKNDLQKHKNKRLISESGQPRRNLSSSNQANQADFIDFKRPVRTDVNVDSEVGMDMKLGPSFVTINKTSLDTTDQKQRQRQQQQQQHHVKKRLKEKAAEMDQCPICDRSVLKSELQAHVNACLDTEDFQSEFLCAGDEPRKQNVNVNNASNSNSTARCPICDADVAKSELEAHVEGCMTSAGLNDAF